MTFMKKLLILLSVLIISGTTIPNVIAAGNYQKTQHKIEKKLKSI